MAKIKTSALIADIKGTVGGNVFAANKGGNYVRRWKKGTNANTVSQQVVRDLFATQSGLWRTLTEEQRSSWITGAVNFPYLDSLGESRIYSGQQLFNKLNNNLIQAGFATIESCPTPQSFPQVEWLGVENAVAGNVLAINLTVGGALTVPAGFNLVIIATTAMSAGVNSPSLSLNRKITIIEAAGSVEEVPIDVAYNTIFGSIALGDAIFINAMLVNATSGEASALVRIKSVRVA
jgi:hypothetical protein